jgi:hypothetical protein
MANPETKAHVALVVKTVQKMKVELASHAQRVQILVAVRHSLLHQTCRSAHAQNV